MRLVDIQNYIRIFTLEFDESVDVGHIAVHAVDALDYYEHILMSGCLLLQHLFEMIEIIVAEPLKRCFRKHYAIDNACMNKLIGQNQRLLSGYRTDKPGVGMVTAVEKKCSRILAAMALIQQREENLKIGVFYLTRREESCRRRSERHLLRDGVGKKLGLKLRLGCQAHIIVCGIIGQRKGHHRGNLAVVSLLMELLQVTSYIHFPVSIMFNISEVRRSS